MGNSKRELINVIYLFVGFLGFFLDVFATALTLDETYSDLKDLCIPLNALELAEKDEYKKTEIRNLKEDIRSTEQISAAGFFALNKSSFVSFLSFAVTNIVILLQFKMGEQ